MSGKVDLIIRCGKCGKACGEVDMGEREAHWAGEFTPGLCFDCDPESAATTPSIFWQWHAGELIDIGESRFCVTADEKQIVEVGSVPAHERTRARGSSSYTYLNGALHNHALLGNGVEVRPCVRCHGEGFIDTFHGLFTCEPCQGSGLRESAIVIPSWILGLGCENAR